jgi:hypothetical protein
MRVPRVAAAGKASVPDLEKFDIRETRFGQTCQLSQATPDRAVGRKQHIHRRLQHLTKKSLRIFEIWASSLQFLCLSSQWTDKLAEKFSRIPRRSCGRASLFCD